MRDIVEIVLDSIFGAGFIFLMIIAFVGQAIVNFLDHYFFITVFVFLLLRTGKRFLAYVLSQSESEELNQYIVQPLRRGHLLEQWYRFSQNARYQKLQKR